MRQGVALSPGGSDGHDARSGSAPMTALSPEQEELCRQDRWDFSGLRAMFVNFTLKRSPEQSHTQGLADISMENVRPQWMCGALVAAIDPAIATAVLPDMTARAVSPAPCPGIHQRTP